MKSFHVTLYAQAMSKIIVYAETPEEAVALARKRDLGKVAHFVPDSVEPSDEDADEAWTVIGRCGSCDGELLQGPGKEEPASMDEGGYLCRPCAKGAPA